jgi:hypothetical protein
MALLVCPRKLKQVFWNAEQGRIRHERAGFEVCPLSGDHGLASIRQNHDELQVATAVRVPKNL